MFCKHNGFYSCSARYDRERAQLVYVMTCDRCGVQQQEVSREAYQPRFDPRGNERFLTALR